MGHTQKKLWCANTFAKRDGPLEKVNVTFKCKWNSIIIEQIYPMMPGQESCCKDPTRRNPSTQCAVANSAWVGGIQSSIEKMVREEPTVAQYVWSGLVVLAPCMFGLCVNQLGQLERPVRVLG